MASKLSAGTVQKFLIRAYLQIFIGIITADKIKIDLSHEMNLVSILILKCTVFDMCIHRGSHIEYGDNLLDK